MRSLSTFNKIYLLSVVAFLISLSHYVNNNTLHSFTNSHIDIDESNQLYPNSDFHLEAIAMNLEINVTAKNQSVDIEADTNTFEFLISQNEAQTTQIKPDFWTTLYSIESKQGRLLYRPNNKSRHCKTTSSPCGHHQLSLIALKDISCATKQCMNDRENFEKSLAMSKQLQVINHKRLKKAGYINLPEYQNYLIHQQGATGFKIILAASQGKKLLSRNMKKNMAGNSPYSYKKLRSFGSKLAVKKFLQYWEEKWQNEKELVLNLKL